VILVISQITNTLTNTFIAVSDMFVPDVLLTVEHVKHVLNIEVQKADSLLLSVDRLEENESF